jgi:hypothetical protein
MLEVGTGPCAASAPSGRITLGAAATMTATRNDAMAAGTDDLLSVGTGSTSSG